VFLEEGTHLKVGITHLEAERFGFLRSGDDAAIVIGQNDHRPSPELRPEKHLHRCKAVITID